MKVCNYLAVTLLSLIIVISVFVCPVGRAGAGYDYYEVTIYPSVDGGLYHTADPWPALWTVIRDGAGTHTNTGVEAHLAQDCYKVSGQPTPGTVSWYRMWRTAFIFDTSIINDEAIVDEVKFYVYGYNKYDELGISPNTNIVEIETEFDESLVIGDYDGFGEVVLSSAIAYSAWNCSGYNVFQFNEEYEGLVDVEGYTKIGIRNESYDINDVEPTIGSSVGGSGVHVYFVEKGGDYRPKLVVKYKILTLPSGLQNFQAVRVDEYSVNLSWEYSENGSMAMILRDYAGYNADNSTGYLVYSGDMSWALDLGCPDILPFFFTGWEYNDAGYSLPAYYYIGGEHVDVDVTLELSISAYLFIATLVLMLIAFFIKSPFISLAVFFCTIALAVLPPFTDSPFVNVTWAIMAWSILATIKRFMDWRGE